MQEVQALCDRVVIINKGIIVGDGNIQMLSQNLSNAYRVEVTFSRPVVDITLREIKRLYQPMRMQGIIVTSSPVKKAR